MSIKLKNKEDYLTECQQIAKKRGGKCLSNEYVNTHTKLEWECAKGHNWMTEPRRIKSNRWCPDCAKEMRGSHSKLTIEEMQAVAEKRNGSCLSEKYINSKTKLKWRCSKGHEWEAIYDSIRSGKWCPECGRQKSILSRTFTNEDTQKLAKKRGGKCLSNEYVNNHTKLEWECVEGHQWKAVYNSIQQGNWCPVCAGQCLSIEDVQKLAQKRGGKCLSKVYERARNDLTWQCSEGHVWKTTYTNIQKGRWCPECSSRKRHTIKDAQEIAQKQGGKCLSTEYEKTNVKLRWQCLEGHQWEAVFSSVQGGRWCPVCAGNQILSIEDAQKIAKRQGGKCLSNEYINSNAKLKWRCSKGHVWYVKYSHVKAGSWCPVCAGNQLHSIEDAQEIAKGRGGKCRSKVYKGANYKLKWECKNGHKWEATYGNIQSGKWCPECSFFYSGEEFCRLSFESLFKCKFSKSYPNWLKSKEGHQLELDGYARKLKIAFEHHGTQHYRYHNRFHKSPEDFDKQKARDLYKRELCEKHDIILIEIPQVPDVISFENLIPYIIQELKNNKVRTAHLDHETPNYNEIYLINGLSEAYAELKNIAEKKNGNILSDKYIGPNIKLEFECKEGHKWRTLPTNVKGGTWCPKCANIHRNDAKKLTIEQMQLIAKERGGKCLSEEYTDNKIKLKWMCSEGHIWQAKPSHIKSGVWCPVCGKIKQGLSRRLSIEEAQKIAKDRGGKCLSEKYDVAPNKLIWQCSKGHQWNSTYTNIQSGRWCPECVRKKKKL